MKGVSMKRCKCGAAILPEVDRSKPSERISFPDGDRVGMVVAFPVRDPSGNLCYYHQKEENKMFNFIKSADKICLEGESLWRNLRSRKVALGTR